MPLVILGLIVVLGAALLIYYQLGPKVTLRLRGRSGFGGFGGADADADKTDEKKSETAETGIESPAIDTADKEKVLFIFGDGEREERPLRGSGEKDEGE